MLQFLGFYSRWQTDKELGAEGEQRCARRAGKGKAATKTGGFGRVTKNRKSRNT